MADLVGAHRLVTLVGVGGVGKSSVAVEAARRIQGDLDVVLVDLSASPQGLDTAAAVADLLGLPVSADVGPMEAIATRFAVRPYLLVLDNAETQPEAVASLVDELLSQSPDLHVLATSRTRLDVEGETVHLVQPLELDRRDGHPSPAVTLLIDRARAAGAVINATDPAVADLAERLDGIPLAIELAAARLNALSAASLLEDFDELRSNLQGTRRSDERHQSLSSVVEWSVNLLSDEHRHTLTRLSVFAGGFTLDAAQAIVGPEVRDALPDLVNASLMQRDSAAHGNRYRLLEVVRRSGLRRLRADGEIEEITGRHARYFAQWATVALNNMRGPEEVEWVHRYRDEIPNMSDALRWAARAEEGGLVNRLAGALGDSIFLGSTREMHALIDEVTEILDDPYAIENLAMAATYVATRRGDLDRMQALLDDLERRGHRGLDFLQSAEAGRGALASFRGRPADAIAHFTRAADEATDVAPAAELLAQAYAALAVAYSGDHRAGYERAVVARRAAERLEWTTGICVTTYVEAECMIGFDPPAALEAYRRASELNDLVDNPFNRAVNLISWATAEARFGGPHDAVARFAEALDYFGSTGSWSYVSTLIRNLTELLVRIERYEDAYVLRTALDGLEGTTRLAGADVARNSYLMALLEDRLVGERRSRLAAQAATLARGDVAALAERIVTEEKARLHPDRAIRAVVFTDLEGATSFMAERGDHESRQIMRRYEALQVRCLSDHAGQRIKGTGDGMLLVFASVTDALASLQALMSEIAEHPDAYPLKVRAGVHAGELIDETAQADGDDIYGTVVNLTARLVDQADGGEIVLSNTARQIVVGSGARFTSLGDAELKGIPEPIRLYRYEWNWAV